MRFPGGGRGLEGTLKLDHMPQTEMKLAEKQPTLAILRLAVFSILASFGTCSKILLREVAVFALGQAEGQVCSTHGCPQP